MIYVAGLDLGQAQDYSALSILEVEATPHTFKTARGPVYIDGLPIIRMACRHLERFPLQTRYVDIAKQVHVRLKTLPSRMEQYLAVDKTGVGRGPIELMEPLHPIGITITSGNYARQGESIRDWHVPKRDLVGTAQVALQTKLLTVSNKLPMAAVLCKELLAFKMKISAEGHDSYNAWRESDHDDLVLAVAIAGWTAQQVIALTYQLELERLNAPRGPFSGEGSISPI